MYPVRQSRPTVGAGHLLGGCERGPPVSAAVETAPEPVASVRTFEAEGRRFEGRRFDALPCESWTCRRPHTALRCGPAMFSYHEVRP